jgi:hypothetical protein
MIPSIRTAAALRCRPAAVRRERLNGMFLRSRDMKAKGLARAEAEEEPGHAAVWPGAAAGLRTAIGAPLPPVELGRRAQTMSILEAALGAAATSDGMAKGKLARSSSWLPTPLCLSNRRERLGRRVRRDSRANSSRRVYTAVLKEPCGIGCLLPER